MEGVSRRSSYQELVTGTFSTILGNDKRGGIMDDC